MGHPEKHLLSRALWFAFGAIVATSFLTTALSSQLVEFLAPPARFLMDEATALALLLKPSALDENKGKLEALEALVTATAFIAAALWALVHFYRKREGMPHLNVTQRVLPLVDLPTGTIFRVIPTLQNCGAVRVRIECGFSLVRQLSPLQKEVDVNCTSPRQDFPKLCRKDMNPDESCEIEPNEMTEEVQFDFFIASQVETVFFYTYFQNAAKRSGLLRRRAPAGWMVTTFYSVKERREVSHEQGQGKPTQKATTPADSNSTASAERRIDCK